MWCFSMESIIIKIRKQVCCGSLVVFVLEIPSSHNLSHIPLWDNWKQQGIFLPRRKKTPDNLWFFRHLLSTRIKRGEKCSPLAVPVKHLLYRTGRHLHFELSPVKDAFPRPVLLGKNTKPRSSPTSIPPFVRPTQLQWRGLKKEKIKVLKGSLPSPPSPYWLASKFTAFQMASSQ